MINQKKDTTVSLCMMVRNEEKYLADCLSSIKDNVDQLIIIDTVSTDNTIDIANSFGAEVYHFDWRDDFSLARNESIKYAKCDWILWMDADEILDPDSIEEYKRCISNKEKPVYYKVMIRSNTGDEKSIHDSDTHRLFSNNFGIKFQNRIHEQISYSAHKIGAIEKISSILLYHKGYDVNESDLEKKILRNRKLLTKMVEDFPNDAYSNFTLAQNYGQAKEWKLMIHHLERALELESLSKPMQASL